MRWLRSHTGEYLPVDWQRVAYVVVQGDFSVVTPRYADGSHVFVLDETQNREFVSAVYRGINAEPNRWISLREYVTGSTAELLPNTAIIASKPQIVRMFDTEADIVDPSRISGVEVYVSLVDPGPPLGIAVGRDASHLRKWARSTWPR